MRGNDVAIINNSSEKNAVAVPCASKLMRNPYARHIDFSAFIGVIPSNKKFCPSNIDGVIERKGCFLWMEWKREGERISDGQKFLLKSLANQHRFQVLIIRGDTDFETIVHDFWILLPQGRFIRLGKSLEELTDFIRQWYEWADKGK